MTRLVSVFGDSISTFVGTQPEGYAVYYGCDKSVGTGIDTPGDTWWAQVIAALGGTLLSNASWSGSMVEGEGFPAGESARRIEALANSRQTPDDIVVYYGTNDYGWGSPHAQAAGRASATPPCLQEQGRLPREAQAGLAPDDAAQRFGLAFERMLSTMRTLYPNARIWCFGLAPGRVQGAQESTFPRAYRGVPFADYNNAIEAACKTTGVHFCDMSAFGLDYEGAEGTHPTTLGMQQLAWMAIRLLQEAGECTHVDTGPYPGPGSFENTDPCDAPGQACVGCPHALATGNQWMHVCMRREPDLFANVQ